MLTPLDIENKKFSKQVVNGYNTEEIDEFLDEVLKDYETIYMENVELKGKASSLNDEITHYKSIEDSLQNALMLAQNAAEDLKRSAEREAETMLADANQKVKEAMTDIDKKIAIREVEYNHLCTKYSVYKAKMESLLIAQLELLKEHNNQDDE